MSSPGSAPAIRAVGLRRSYGKQLVLDGIDLEVAAGTVFALLGPNGAGKTTVIKVLTTLLLPTSGKVTVLGYDVLSQSQEVRKRIGLILGGQARLMFEPHPLARVNLLCQAGQSLGPALDLMLQQAHLVGRKRLVALLLGVIDLSAQALPCLDQPLQFQFLLLRQTTQTSAILRQGD